MSVKSNYYVSSFFWSTLAKVLNAILGFISIPLLLGYYGKADYGILSIATACNAYMHVLDLGMNTGAVKFFSQWRTEGKNDLINRVARTNYSFYILISIVNIVGLLALAVWGEPLFSISAAQFCQLRVCFYILAAFAVFNWVSTAFNQLLVADKQMAFTMKMQCVQILLKMALVFMVLWLHLSLSVYFLFLTMTIALLIVPYAIKCRRDNLVDSLLPGNSWKDFGIVMKFSLSLFALSLIQVTSTQSRPILLSMFSQDGAESVADFRILEVMPAFIITVGGTFSGIFLPKSAEMVARKDQSGISSFAYGWTKRTTILANILCVPFILSAREALSAYVGVQYASLSTWLIVWLLTVLVQIHTTPGNSLLLAYGKTAPLLITSGVACVLSMLINILLAGRYGAGAAVIGYFVYVIIVIGLYYVAYYKKLMKLSRWAMFKSFALPTAVSFAVLGAVWFVPFHIHIPHVGDRLNWIIICLVKTLSWLLPYVAALLLFRVIRPDEVKALWKR